MDRVECAAFGHSPKQALILGLRGSSLAWTVLGDGRPVAMLGVAPISVIDGRGAIWMLATDDAYQGRRLWIKLAPKMIKAMLDEWPRLENLIAVENVKAVRVLKWLGFQFDGEVRYERGVPFRRFWRTRE